MEIKDSRSMSEDPQAGAPTAADPDVQAPSDPGAPAETSIDPDAPQTGFTLLKLADGQVVLSPLNIPAVQHVPDGIEVRGMLLYGIEQSIASTTAQLVAQVFRPPQVVPANGNGRGNPISDFVKN